MNIKEFALNSSIAAMGTVLSAWLGGWDAALRMLIVFMTIDYATGLLGAIKCHRVDSEVMFWGGIRKGAILAVLIIAVLLDTLVNNHEPVFRTLTIYFYMSREGISVTENLGILGVKLPPWVSRALTQLQEKGGGPK